MAARLPPKKIIFVWIVGSAFVVFSLFSHIPASWKPVPFINHDFLSYNLESEYLDPNQTCLLPKIHPFDNSVLRYLTQPRPLYCKARQGFLTYIDGEGVLRLNETGLRESNYKAPSISCEYQEIFRSPDNDVNIVYGDKQKLTLNGAAIRSDFVSVSCYNFFGFSIYSYIHAQIRRDDKKTWPKDRKDKFSVLIFGIDSLSRLSFIRQLPRTYKYLTEDMGVYVFRGMTKMGDNTFPNLGAILTGKSPIDELPPVEKDQTYDSWPLIWKNFSKEGYVTMYAEDRPDIALFNYLRNGFRKPPTDHYMRPFWLAVDGSSVHRLSSPLCFGPLPKHLLQMKYTGDFVTRYKDVPYYALSFLVELSHDYISQVAVADNDIVEWIRNMHEGGLLNNTVFIFLSDHGHRFDALRATLVGRIEERMPFFAMYVPPSLMDTQPHVKNHLQTNTYRLTSPYDTYYTLVDLMDHGTKGTKLGSATSSRGTSLFGPITGERKCSEAGIPDHYCVCEEEVAVPVEDAMVQRAASNLLDTLNEIILTTQGNFSKCSKVFLKSIHHATLVGPSQKVITNSRIYFGKQVQDSAASGMLIKLRIIVEVSPSDGLFEATVVHRKDENIFSIIGDISRINMYGKQSWCVSDAVLRKYCYCSQPYSGPDGGTGTS